MKDNLYTYVFNLTRVIDGDTYEGDIELGFNLRLEKQRVRLYGVNTPEIKGKQKELGLLVKETVSQRLKDCEILVKSFGYDNFGRVLGVIYYYCIYQEEWIDLAAELLAEKYAEVYEK